MYRTQLDNYHLTIVRYNFFTFMFLIGAIAICQFTGRLFQTFVKLYIKRSCTGIRELNLTWYVETVWHIIGVHLYRRYESRIYKSIPQFISIPVYKYIRFVYKFIIYICLSETIGKVYIKSQYTYISL